MVVDLGDDTGLVTPAMVPPEASGWPKNEFWNSDEPTPSGSTAPRRIGSESRSADEADQLLLAMARTAQAGGLAPSSGKPIMPDTPMKRHPLKQRTWQSTGKDWGLGGGASFTESAGTVKGSKWVFLAFL